MHQLRTIPTRAVIRAYVTASGTRERVADGTQRRLDRLCEDSERGAQAAEYAMLGGVSAAACGALITLLKNPKTLGRVVDSVVSILTGIVKTWL